MIDDLLQQAEKNADYRFNEIINNVISKIDNDNSLKEDIKILKQLFETYVNSKLSFHRLKRIYKYEYSMFDPNNHNELKSKIKDNRAKYHEMKNYIKDKYGVLVR